MSRHESVKALADPAERLRMLIPFIRPGRFRVLRQGLKGGFSPAHHFSIRQNQVNSLLEARFGNLRETAGYTRILESRVFDTVTGGLLPAFDPQLAEVAVAVENHDGLGRRSSDLDVGLHVLTTVNPVSEQGERQSASKRLQTD